MFDSDIVDLRVFVCLSTICLFECLYFVSFVCLSARMYVYLICMFHDWIRLDPRHDVNGFVHVMHYVNSIFHGMVSDALAAAVEQVDLHGHDVLWAA